MMQSKDESSAKFSFLFFSQSGELQLPPTIMCIHHPLRSDRLYRSNGRVKVTDAASEKACETAETFLLAHSVTFKVQSLYTQIKSYTPSFCHFFSNKSIKLYRGLWVICAEPCKILPEWFVVYQAQTAFGAVVLLIDLNQEVCMKLWDSISAHSPIL